MIDTIAKAGRDFQMEVLSVTGGGAIKDGQRGGTIEGRDVQDGEQVGESGQQPATSVQLAGGAFRGQTQLAALHVGNQEGGQAVAGTGAAGANQIEQALDAQHTRKSS